MSNTHLGNKTTGPQPLVGEVQMLRIRVAEAESKLEVLRERARQAKLRRKEAKRIAQRARKQFKRGKADAAELKKCLAQAEAKLFQAERPALATKMGQRKRVMKTSDQATGKAKAPARRRRAAPSVARQPRLAVTHESPVPGRVTKKKPAITEAKVVSDGPADVVALDPSTPQPPEPNS